MVEKDKITYDELKELVNYSLLQFYKYDKILFEYDTESSAVSERCMMFHIGWYMLEKMKTMPKFAWANLDCEYNRNLKYPKSMYMETLAGIKDKIKDTIPDLLIHKRGNNENNLLVIEFKKGSPKKHDKERDMEKLRYFTNKEHEYAYNYGMYIELHKQKADIEVYKDGVQKSHLNYKLPFKR